MFARIVTHTPDHSSPFRIEEGIRRTWEQFPWVRQLDGIEGAYFFVDLFVDRPRARPSS